MHQHVLIFLSAFDLLHCSSNNAVIFFCSRIIAAFINIKGHCSYYALRHSSGSFSCIWYFYCICFSLGAGWQGLAGFRGTQQNPPLQVHHLQLFWFWRRVGFLVLWHCCVEQIWNKCSGAFWVVCCRPLWCQWEGGQSLYLSMSLYLYLSLSLSLSLFRTVEDCLVKVGFT